MDNNSYTRSAQNVLQIAQEQAHYFKHQAVGTEHLLLALSMASNSIAGRVLSQFNITSDDIREEIILIHLVLEAPIFNIAIENDILVNQVTKTFHKLIPLF